MKKLSTIILSALLCVVVLAAAAVSGAAGEQARAASDFSAYGIVLGVGADETERNIAYFSTSTSRGEIRYTTASKVVNGVFPDEYSTVYTTSRPAANVAGSYAKVSTIRGLSHSTSYAYVIVEDGIMSDVYYFETSGDGDFEFVFVGDPQISSKSHGDEWQDTLKTILTEFSDAELLVSAGDQIVTPDSEEHYSYLLVDEMTKLAFAPTVGPVHDSESATFSDHYNLPNKSDKYGVTETSANYWYTYNNALFMHLNMSDTSAATNGEHKAFMKEAMAANPNVMWNIVIMHNSLYSTGSHGDPNYDYFDGEIGKYRPALVPVFTELGIDVVFSGHDHVYVRSKLMDGLEVSGDTVAGNAVFSPVGTLYVCASSSTGSKFYDKKTDSIDQFIAAENYEKRKSAIKVKITDESLVMTSYFLDDMEVFDTFTIQKAPHVCEPDYVEGWEPTCILPGQREYYMCECGTAYEDAAATKSISNLVSYRFIPALTHDYADATCEAAKTCTRCQATTGKALGHKYDAVCDAECNRCNEPRDASEHKDSDNDGSCDRCSATLPVDKKEIPLGLIIGCTVGAAAAITIAAVVVIIIVVSKKKKKI